MLVRNNELGEEYRSPAQRCMCHICAGDASIKSVVAHVAAAAAMVLRDLEGPAAAGTPGGRQGALAVRLDPSSDSDGWTSPRAAGKHTHCPQRQLRGPASQLDLQSQAQNRASLKRLPLLAAQQAGALPAPVQARAVPLSRIPGRQRLTPSHSGRRSRSSGSAGLRKSGKSASVDKCSEARSSCQRQPRADSDLARPDLPWDHIARSPKKSAGAERCTASVQVNVIRDFLNLNRLIAVQPAVIDGTRHLVHA